MAFFILGPLAAPLNAQDVKTLDNGLTVIIKEDRRNPLAVFSMFVDVGSASENEYAGSGMSHLIEHMLFKGTKKYPQGAIEDILHRYGGDINAYTSYDYTGFSITILKEYSGLALDILKEMMTKPVFNPGELKKEMDVIKREMDLIKDDPGHRVSRLTFSTSFTRHPYRMPIIGYKDNFERLNKEDLMTFFKSRYSPEKTVLSIVGDVDKDAILNQVDALFGEIPRGGNIVMPTIKEPRQTQERTAEERLDIDGAYLNIAFRSTDLLDSDLCAMDLLSFILGQAESSILNEHLRMKEKLVLSVSCYNYTPKDPGLFIISSSLKEENVTRAIDAILKQIEDLKNNGVKEEDLATAKNNFLADYIYKKQSIESQANDLAQGQLLAGNPGFSAQYMENIKNIRLADLKRVAQKYLNRESMTITAISKSGKTLSSGRETALKKQARETEKIILSNGLGVLINENDSLPVVSTCVLFKGGLRLENKKNNGISLFSNTMLKDGTDSLKREDIARFYESMAITLNTYSGNNSSGLSATCLKEHLNETLKLLSELCLKSAFSQDEFDREKNEFLSAIDMQDNEIFQQGHRILKQELFRVHPYGFQTIGTRQSVLKITRDDIANFHKNIMTSENMLIGISGDCRKEDVAPVLEACFSAIPSGRADFRQPEKETPVTAKEKREKTLRVDKEQSLILLGFHGMDLRDKDRYALELLIDMLSSSSGILFKEVREETGLSYATGAFNVMGLDPGYITVYCLTSRQNINKAKAIILKNISSISRNEAPERLLEKAKNHVKAMRKLELETNAGFIFSVSMDELYGLGYNNHRGFDKEIDLVTALDIKRIAAKLLSPDKCAIVVLEGTL